MDSSTDFLDSVLLTITEEKLLIMEKLHVGHFWTCKKHLVDHEILFSKLKHYDAIHGVPLQSNDLKLFSLDMFPSKTVY